MSLNERDARLWKLYTNKLFNSPVDQLVGVKEHVMPNKRLDLHGLTVQEAHHKFNQFVQDHAEADTKSIVVITGKSGQIHHEFRDWCRRIRAIRDVEPIIDKHGGIGSWRLTLRRLGATT